MNAQPFDEATAERLATEFTTRLRHALTDDEWAEMRRRNAAYGDPAICASHDFCDANVVMDEAFRAVTGHSIGDREEAGEGGITVEESTLWNRAWDIAKERDLTAETESGK